MGGDLSHYQLFFCQDCIKNFARSALFPAPEALVFSLFALFLPIRLVQFDEKKRAEI